MSITMANKISTPVWIMLLHLWAVDIYVQYLVIIYSLLNKEIVTFGILTIYCRAGITSADS